MKTTTSRRSLAILALLFAALIVGCPDEPDPRPKAYDAFVEELRSRGAVVEEQGTLNQPFIPIAGRTLVIEGESVQVYEFEDGSVAATFAKGISADGSSFRSGDNATIVDWIAPPHIHRSGPLLVIYVGSAPVTTILEVVLGAQIAGR
ncbi:MAG TPA: hypothetical protein QF624_06780 [Dehalococcoidia bacterium]|nr:hypothetical protein [Dehalococcoidia bacterium]